MSSGPNGEFTLMPSGDLNEFGNIRRMGGCDPAVGMKVGLLKSVVRILAPLVDGRVRKEDFIWDCVIYKLALPGLSVRVQYEKGIAYAFSGIV